MSEEEKKDKPGLVKIWYNWLLKVAQSKRDTVNVIKYSRLLFIDNFHSHHVSFLTNKKRAYYLLISQPMYTLVFVRFVMKL